MVWVPQIVMSDNRREFLLVEFEDVLRKHKFQVFMSSYKPSSDGVVERVNRTFGVILLIYLQREKSEIKLSRGRIICNNAVNSPAANRLPERVGALPVPTLE